MNGCIIYVTLESCTMYAEVLVLAGMTVLFMDAMIPRQGGNLRVGGSTAALPIYKS